MELEPMMPALGYGKTRRTRLNAEKWESLESNPIIRGEHSENDNNDSMPSNSGDNNGL